MRTLRLYEDCPAGLALKPDERDLLVISYVRTSGGEVLVVSRYGGDEWDYTPVFPHAARGKDEKTIKWKKFPTAWTPSLKEVAAALTFKRSPTGIRLKQATVPKVMIPLKVFAKWCSSRGIFRFSSVRALDMAQYLASLRAKSKSRTFSAHVTTLRRVYEMRAFVSDTFTAEVFGELSSETLGTLWDPIAAEAARTELIPLTEASELFAAALRVLEDAERLLSMRESFEQRWAAAKGKISRAEWGKKVKRPAVLAAGFKDVHKFETAVEEIRTAGYVVLAQTTGCRVHELGDARVGCVYSEEVDGIVYWWLRSITRKVGERNERWLAPEIARKASDVLTRFSSPQRLAAANRLVTLRKELANARGETRRARIAADIVEMERNVDRLFLSDGKNGSVSTNTGNHNKQLVAFAKRHGVKMTSPLSTHRFRRTYAVLVVRVTKNARIDMVTLQRHLKHASILSTEWYSSLSDTDKELMDLIDEETEIFDMTLVDHWLHPSTPLSGGLGRRIKAYAGQHHQPMFFKSRREFVASIREGLRIRSTGHSWCLAEGEDCGGQGLFEAPRCAGCGNGVIDNEFTSVWQGLKAHHAELVDTDDIGPGGRLKARQAMEASEKVLDDLIAASPCNAEVA